MRVWYNSSLESKNYVVPGLIAVILQIIAALLTSLTIAREWEMGTMEQLLSTPLRPAELVLGKMIGVLRGGGGGCGDRGAGGDLRFRRAVPRELSAAGGLDVRVPVRHAVLGNLCFGRGEDAIAGLPDGDFERRSCRRSCSPGFVYSIETMPAAIQVITHVVSARYLVTILKGIFLKGVGLSVLWGELAFLALYAVIVFLLATRKLNQKLA